MNAHQETSFMLGEVKVSPSHNTLWAHNQSIKLQPKAMEVLHYLARNQSRVISNEELIEQLWEGRVVTHGSVQKSINALRSALCELIGDQELIAHYSKRGYQLMVEPQFLAHALTDTTNEPSAVATQASNTHNLWQWRVAGAALVVLVAIAILYKTINWNTLYLPHNHQTDFHTTQGYTNETGHERSATPHPDNRHLAYIREKLLTDKLTETESEIVIRNAEGQDWRIANSNGNWFKLAWSPTGNNLVAIEVKRRDGLPLGTQFYQPSNYLYSFHIFTLDLTQERLLEKQQLSQWQGQIFSVTWWDENTLEIVAKQGPNSGNGRYRYSILDQQLALLDEVEGAANPVASAVLNQKTAIASRYKNKIQIDFLNAQQERISRVKLEVTAADITWIPDGSGVLIYAEEERKLIAVYLDGKQTPIPLADNKDKIFSRPHYSADGNGIFYTEEKRSSNILLVALDGAKTRLTENTDFNYAASFSPNGEKVVYASVRNNQIHLWLVENGQERQLTTQPAPKKVDSIIWSDDGEHIVFNADNQIYHHNLLTHKTALLLSGTDTIEPIAYFPTINRLFALKHNGEIRNLWRIEGEQWKQLTFGAVGSAIEYGGDIYFQYVSENGLWALRGKNDTLERVTANLDEYSKLLKAGNKGIYFMSGGVCQESDIYYLDYAAASKSTFLIQESSAVSTTSFNIDKGLLQTECYLPEANIVLLK
ncbi:winged helix-turn-helix domain-containing protein [Cellvibrio fibrivorans]|uniref:DNA-binding winged helix-turn-helix (WHTH) protein/Tol biopolymer transport system component n=1 Tax=Cellvibrio fibrivorans TaxID=126350 RepID=A0ABU1UY20_9GAMM|nr:winged helix-turn-helix domain-containing protein [Cellvibrio fibrivorans]MDR7090089.1 DNA-binding winged helix-turn-helix (wHTH) protein/Tol biopolymer transport system component [Cellvibrio fibrivorans]